MNIYSLLARNASKFPAEEALVFRDERQTWEQLGKRVDKLAAAMARLGVRKGDRVAILLENCAQFVEIHFAAARLGAIGVPLNYRLVGDELAFILNNSETKMLFYGSKYLEVLGAVKKDLPLLKFYLEVSPDGGQYEEFLLSGDQPPEVGVQGEDPNVILYTSGTTGRPKGAVLTHDNSLWNALNMVIDARFEQTDRGIVIPPLYHSAALNCWMLPHVLVGAGLVIENSFDPRKLPQRLLEEKVTNIFLVPAMYSFLLQVPGLDNYDFSAIRIAGTGASIMPVELKQRVRKLFPEAGIIDVYGLTEAGPGVTILKPQDAFRKEGSVGKALTALEVRLVNGQGLDVPMGDVGEIIVRGPTVMRGYYNLPEATADALRNGWLYTGDLARQDEEGYLYVVDRKKDMVISGGENVYPAEVEAVLHRHPKILEAAVFGIPNAKWGESVWAVVVPKPGEQLTEDEVIQFTTGKLAGYKKPRRVEFAEALPRNPSGKVLKTVLRSKYSGDET